LFPLLLPSAYRLFAAATVEDTFVYSTPNRLSELLLCEPVAKISYDYGALLLSVFGGIEELLLLLLLEVSATAR